MLRAALSGVVAVDVLVMCNVDECTRCNRVHGAVLGLWCSSLVCMGSCVGSFIFFLLDFHLEFRVKTIYQKQAFFSGITMLLRH